MESEGGESSHLHPKHSKPTNPSQFSSTSMQKSSFKIPVLPAELITEILSRLPVKSLLQLRCVSKSWLALISSPEFSKTQLSMSANNNDFTHHRLMLSLVQSEYNLKDCSLSTLLYDYVTRAFDLDYPMKNLCNFVEIVGSVNGLICLTIEGKDSFLWNPSIRKFKKLPDSIAILGMSHFHFMDGFGYDALDDDYKVVRGFRNLSYNNSCYIEVQIYSLNSDSWKSIDHFLSGELAIKSGMFVNGKLHWLNKTSQDLHSYNDWDIISIDLANGKWGKVEKPCYGEGGSDFKPFLGVLGSDLSVFCNNRKRFANLWVMKVYGVKESWTKMFNINVWFPVCEPFCMSNKGDVLFQFGSTFIIYNPKDDSIRYPKVTDCDALFEAKIYIESLVWPFPAEVTKDATTTKTDQVQMKIIV